MAAATADLRKLITDQMTLAMSTLRARDSQTPLAQGNYYPLDQGDYSREPRAARDMVISSVETLASQTGKRNSPIRGMEAQELNDGTDLTFKAWRLQVLARFRDDPV